MRTTSTLSNPLLAAGILFLLLCIPGHPVCAAQGQSAIFDGPFQITWRSSQDTAQYFYILNASGEPFTLNINCIQMANVSPEQMLARPCWMVRIFDPEETLFFRGTITSPKQSTQEKTPSQLSIDIPRSEPNSIIQAVVGGGKVPSGIFSLHTTPKLPFGIMGSVNVITPPKKDITTGYFYIPPGAKKLELEPIDAEIAIWDEHDKPISNPLSIPIETHDVVWKMRIKPGKWPGAKIYTTGFPVILCPDPNTAAQIKASIEYLDDGTVVAHKFQVRLDRLLRQTFSEPNQFKLFPIQSLKPIGPIFAHDPLRYQYLLTTGQSVYPYIYFWFDTQVLDAKSPFFGGIYCPSFQGNNYKPYTSMPKAATIPPTTYAQEHHQWVGFSPWQIHDSMAFLYTLDGKINPYYHDKNLLHRVIISACRDLILLDEQELIFGKDQYIGDWMTTYAFNFRFRFADAFGYIGQDVKKLYPEIYRQWEQGLMRYADRITDMNIYPPANQSAHIPYCIWQVYKGSLDPYYSQQTQDSLKQFIRILQKPAGYYIEGYGPDSGYTFITLDLLAMIYRDTQWPFLKDSIQRGYTLFNHSTVPETARCFVGSTDFNHRNIQPWPNTPERAGRIMMAGILPEAGLWFRNITPQEERGVRQVILAKLPEIPYTTESILKTPSFDPTLINGSGRHYYEYHYDTLNSSGKLPCEESQSFIRNLGNEFIAVKKPGYYLLIYVGKPGASEKDLVPDKVGPRTGGGISLLWTPENKTVIAAQNWNTFCHHGIIAETDKPQYTDYDSVGFALNTEKSTLTVMGNISHTPISYIRKYTFEDQRILITTELTSAADFTARQCYIQVPLFMSKESAKSKLRLSDGDISVADKAGKNLRLTFFPALPVKTGQLTQKQFGGIDYPIQQIQIMLPATWTKNEPFRINEQWQF